MQPVFRPLKRRNVTSRKPASDAQPDGVDPSNNAHQEDGPEYSTSPSIPIAPPARRTLGALRRGGVGFNSARADKMYRDPVSSTEVVSHRPQEEMLIQASSRFVAPTGQTITLDDKHMTAYIDTRLADLSSTHAAVESRESDSTEEGRATSAFVAHPAQRRPHDSTNLSHGAQSSVQEVMLSTEATKQPRSSIQPIPKSGFKQRSGNKKRLVGSAASSAMNTSDRVKPANDANASSSSQAVPVAKRRRRHERTDAEKARDALVEQFLSENRLENVYGADAQSAQVQEVAPGHNQEADLRLADEFRREFLAEAEERQFRRRPPQAPSTSTVGQKRPDLADATKGPKLGGSRSQRAAMNKVMEEALKK